MNEEQTKALDKVLEALCFYANKNIYWGRPISLDLNLDRRTLKIARDHIEDSEILKDSGEIAREALYEFEGVFQCEYEKRTEI